MRVGVGPARERKRAEGPRVWTAECRLGTSARGGMCTTRGELPASARLPVPPRFFASTAIVRAGVGVHAYPHHLDRCCMFLPDILLQIFHDLFASAPLPERVRRRRDLLGKHVQKPVSSWQVRIETICA